MSVCIAAIPVALALRVVMGKEGFENFVRSGEVHIPTNFATKLELTRTVKKAGYDVQEFGAVLKTHVNGKKDYFFWECLEGKWVAVWSRYDDVSLQKKFMANIEAVAGGRVFGELPEKLVQQTIQTFPTNFRDGTLLCKVLEELGTSPVTRANGSISCRIDKSELVFTQTGDSPYRVEVKNGPAREQIYHYLSGIDEDYKRCVQTVVYEKLKQRAVERNMIVESEEVLQDKTILVTLQVL